MEKGKKYLFENLRPNFKRLNTSKVNFRDDNDLLNLASKEKTLIFAKNFNLICLALTSVFFLNIFYNLFQITLNSEKNRKFYSKVNIERGKIFDRNGTLIATNLPTFDLYLNTKKLINRKIVKGEIEKIFKNKKSSFINYAFSKKHYILIQNNLSNYEINQLKKIGDPGLVFEKSQKRIYPQHNLFCHITGFLSKFYEPKSKIEKNFHNKLSNGKNIRLSLDLRIQSIVHEELSRSMKKYEANSALALVMNVNNGEIISMVSLPDFDPNYPEEITAFSENNLVTEARYEMGSTLKIFNAALAYEIESLATKEIFDVEFPYQITHEKQIKDEIKGEKKLTFDDIFIKSSNIGSIKLLDFMGHEKQKDFFKKIGLTENLNVSGLKTVSNNLPDYWNITASKFISFGYGISLSPISLASSFSTLVNGGFKVKPTISLGESNQIKRILDIKTSEKINSLLKRIVEEGTGKKAKVLGLEVGGKTGTSEKFVDGNYNSEKVITSFIGVFPIKEPKYLTLVLFDEPKRTNNRFLEYFGGDTAAPTFSEITKKISPILDKRNYLDSLALN
ncbi:MAG: hypothetical protein CMP34_02095 [Rickettsiales bacterium]|nr:hypothetical protein [Rickettsiales bacterium]